MKALSSYLFSHQLLECARLKPTYFTRQRCLPFPTVLAFLLCGVQGAVQSELDQFFANLRDRANSVRVVTAQAFSKARHKIRAEVFTQINQRLISLVEEHLPIARWRGLRVVAGDGTAVRLTLLNDEGLRHIVQAVAFGLYLPESELFVDFALCEPVGDERVRLFERLHLLRPDDLLVLDRGFPCRWLVSALSAQQMAFCIRCDIHNGFKAVQRFIRSGLAEQQVRLPTPPKKAALAYGCPRMPTTVRLVRVVAPNTRQYVIMTSLLDPIAYPAAGFAQLYHGRWRVEEAFKRIKHRLGLEHTSGLSWQAAQQDFGAKAVYDNLASLAAWVATEEHLPDDSPYKINRTQAIDKIKRYLGRWLLLAASGLRGLRAVLNEIAMNVQKFVPNRSRPRPHRPKPHRYHAYKPV